MQDMDLAEFYYKEVSKPVHLCVSSIFVCVRACVCVWVFVCVCVGVQLVVGIVY